MQAKQMIAILALFAMVALTSAQHYSYASTYPSYGYGYGSSYAYPSYGYSSYAYPSYGYSSYGYGSHLGHHGSPYYSSYYVAK